MTDTAQACGKRKPVKAQAEYVVHNYLFSQRQVTEALGLKFKANQIVRVYCDGDNKVRVEAWHHN